MQLEMIKPVDKKITFGSSEESSKPTAKIEDGVDKFTKGADAVADGIDKANDSVKKIIEKGGAMSATAGGIWAFFKKPILSFIDWMKKDALDESGKPIIEIINGSEVTKRVWNKNKVLGAAIAAGVIAIGVATTLIAKAVKSSKAKKAAEAAEKAKEEKAKSEAEAEKAKAIAEAEAEKAKAEAEKAKAEAEKAKADSEKTNGSKITEQVDNGEIEKDYDE